MTTFLAISFMVNSVILTTLTSKTSKKSLFDDEAPIAAPLNSDSAATAIPAAAPTKAAPAKKVETKK